MARRLHEQPAHLLPSLAFPVPFERHWQGLYNPRPRQISQEDSILETIISVDSVLLFFMLN